jgi:hypothetical protein
MPGEQLVHGEAQAGEVQLALAAEVERDESSGCPGHRGHVVQPHLVVGLRREDALRRVDELGPALLRAQPAPGHRATLAALLICHPVASC